MSELQLERLQEQSSERVVRCLRSVRRRLGNYWKSWNSEPTRQLSARTDEKITVLGKFEPTCFVSTLEV
jgi:hypothetical protein